MRPRSLAAFGVLRGEGRALKIFASRLPVAHSIGLAGVEVEDHGHGRASASARH